MIATRLTLFASLALLGCRESRSGCFDEAEFGVTMNSFAVSASEALAVVDMTVTTVPKDPCEDDFGGGNVLNSVHLDDFASTTLLGGVGIDLVVPPSRDVAVWAQGDNLGIVDMATLAVSTIDVSNWGSAGVAILLSDGTIAFPMNGAGSFIGVLDAETETTTFHAVPWEPYRLAVGDGSVYAALIGTAGIAEVSLATWEVLRIIPTPGPYAAIALQGTNLAAHVYSSGVALEIDTVTGATTLLAADGIVYELAYVAPHRWLGFATGPESFLFDFVAGTVTTLQMGLSPSTPILVAERGELFVPFYEGFAVIDVEMGSVSYGGNGDGVAFAKRLSDGRIIGVRDVSLPRGSAPSSVDDAIRILDPALDYEVVERYPLAIPPEL